jgi:hypothetical protein
MPEVVLSEYVEPELDAIWQYIALDNIDAADRFVESACSTVDPPPGSGSFAFRIWRVENCLQQEWPAAPDALKVTCAKNFSTPATFGIMPEVSEID